MSEPKKLVESPGVPEIVVWSSCACGEVRAMWNGWDIATWPRRAHVPERLADELGACPRVVRRRVS